MPSPTTRTSQTLSSKKTGILVACLCVLAIGTILASVPYGEAPSEGPERIFLSWTGDPATTQAVTWRMDVGQGIAQAQLCVKKGSAVPVDGVTSATATTQSITIGRKKKVYYHAVNFEGLKPSTEYVYRVGDGTKWSEWDSFVTASDRPEPFRFVYLGDAQNSVRRSCGPVFRAAQAKAPDALLYVHAGDEVEDHDADEEWGEWSDAMGPIVRTTSCFITPGNHEMHESEIDGETLATISDLWRPHYAFPLNGPAGLEELAFYTDLQGVRFVSLDGNHADKKQAAWLEGVLAKNPCRWTIVVTHQPMYSTAKQRDHTGGRRMFGPLFDKYRVDLVLQGHDHNYGRSRLVREERLARPGEAGTVYCVSICGPKHYAVNPKYEALMKKQGTGIQLFQTISIDGNALRYESWTVSGGLYDAFELHKDSNGVNELIESMPDENGA